MISFYGSAAHFRPHRKRLRHDARGEVSSFFSTRKRFLAGVNFPPAAKGVARSKSRETLRGIHTGMESTVYQRFLPSITTTSTPLISKSSKRRALTLIFGLSKLGSPSDQSGVSVNVPQPQTGQK